MQTELAAEYPNLPIHIIGINQIGAETGMTDVALMSTLPVVNDDTNENVWTDWGAQWRDVKILNANNEIVTTYNLTTYNLADQANYDALKQLFIDAATQN